MRSSRNLDPLSVMFDDDRLVDSAGLVLAASLAEHLKLGDMFERRLSVAGSAGAHAGDKSLTLVHSLLAGGDCIDDANALRAGATGRVLGHRVMAPSTLGTFLRHHTWGHVRQLDVVAGDLLARAWSAGAGPGDAPVTVDVDATMVTTFGLAKQGARKVTRKGRRAYNPLLAVVSGTGDVVHARNRRGEAHDSVGAKSFVTETINRVRAAGASGPMLLRGDSAFYRAQVVAACGRADVRFSLTARMQKGMRAAIEAIPEADWVPVEDYDNGTGIAHVAEIGWVAFNRGLDRKYARHRRPLATATPVRLIIRRVAPTPSLQQKLFLDFSYHPFITDRDGDTLELEADHRRHAEIENTIRDLKYGMGLNHMPSGRFAANSAWLVLNVIAHNLARWTSRIALGETLITTKTLRRRHLNMPGRMTRSARRQRLHLPRHWPWAAQFIEGLARVRAIPLTT